MFQIIKSESQVFLFVFVTKCLYFPAILQVIILSMAYSTFNDGINPAEMQNTFFMLCLNQTILHLIPVAI